jgi:integrase
MTGIHILTKAAICKARDKAKANPGKVTFLSDGAGLYARLQGNAASWVFRARMNGKLKDKGLGPLHTVDLDEARERALSLRKQVRKLRSDTQSVSPQPKITWTRFDPTAPSFRTIAEEYIAKQYAQQPSSAREWSSTLGKLALADMPVDLITTETVRDAILPMWKKNKSAKRVVDRVRIVLDAAAVQGLRNGNLKNPATWKGHLEHVLPKHERVAEKPHHAAMPWQDLPAFMARLRSRDDGAARALEFTILTAARTGEVVTNVAREIKGDLWMVPAERMKRRIRHVVPLSARAQAIADAVRVPHEKALIQLLQRRMKVVDASIHGFRACFSTWAAEHGWDSNLVELALAHNIKSSTKAAYNRTNLVEQRRPLMAAWASYLSGAE